MTSVEKSVAGLAANYSNRSNSVSYRNPANNVASTPTTANTTNLTHSASIACRKPSFKFESNILNRVQNMSNGNKMKCFNKNNGALLISTSSQKNNTETIESTEIKRNSLNNETQHQSCNTSSEQIKLLKRHQSINKSVITNETIANMLKPSNLMNAKMNLINNITQQSTTTSSTMMTSNHHNSKSNHQISLDSGIYLPSESEDCSFQMNVAYN